MREMSETDRQYEGRLIDEYMTLKDIRDMAKEENAVETVKLIDKKMQTIKLKLQPTELPD